MSHDWNACLMFVLCCVIRSLIWTMISSTDIALVFWLARWSTVSCLKGWSPSNAAGYQCPLSSMLSHSQGTNSKMLEHHQRDWPSFCRPFTSSQQWCHTEKLPAQLITLSPYFWFYAVRVDLSWHSFQISWFNGHTQFLQKFYVTDSTTVILHTIDETEILHESTEILNQCDDGIWSTCLGPLQWRWTWKELGSNLCWECSQIGRRRGEQKLSRSLNVSCFVTDDTLE